ncbi:MAG: YbhB/YbcL family Raf kinase inhibitor-like protein [Sorangiineae bacterium]|nr:YbhB/YbcL family Raf kinase inhibitor-like protein [Polyangiaceae bacterium]MEB2323626.1 YbhB/YbcL family Raf kinase inhibitor-like protein [Sorangiineae bacterium]
MKVTSRSFQSQARIPGRFALGVPGDSGPVPGPNLSPHLAWSEVPEGTRSFAIICHDSDAPSRADDVNQAGRVVPYQLARVDFFHWVLVDIPPSTRELAEGADADGLVARGKPVGPTAHGVRGVNSYTSWFAGDAAMSGDYGGYDGPWPPFNDERVHRYTFTVYAVDAPSLGLSGPFTGDDARRALAGHVLAEASVVGTYSLYADAR